MHNEQMQVVYVYVFFKQNNFLFYMFDMFMIKEIFSLWLRMKNDMDFDVLIVNLKY